MNNQPSTAATLPTAIVEADACANHLAKVAERYANQFSISIDSPRFKAAQARYEHARAVASRTRMAHGYCSGIDCTNLAPVFIDAHLCGNCAGYDGEGEWA